MAKIFRAPDDIQPKPFNPNTWRKDDAEYIKKLKEFCIQQDKSNTPEVGEVIGFPVADGTAQYMVLSMKPLQLIHLELGDAYYIQHEKNLKAKDVRSAIESRKAMERLFAPRQQKTEI